MTWKKIEIDGQTRTIAEWCRYYGRTTKLVYSRRVRGWDLVDALRTPPWPRKKITIKGQARTLQQWAKRIGISNQAMWNRLQTNKSDDELVAPNKQPNARITAFGKTQSISQWARETGIGRSCISWRLRQGVPAEVALTTPARKQSRYKQRKKAATP